MSTVSKSLLAHTYFKAVTFLLSSCNFFCLLVRAWLVVIFCFAVDAHATPHPAEAQLQAEFSSGSQLALKGARADLGELTPLMDESDWWVPRLVLLQGIDANQAHEAWQILQSFVEQHGAPQVAFGDLGIFDDSKSSRSDIMIALEDVDEALAALHDEWVEGMGLKQREPVTWAVRLGTTKLGARLTRAETSQVMRRIAGIHGRLNSFVLSAGDVVWARWSVDLHLLRRSVPSHPGSGKPSSS